MAKSLISLLWLGFIDYFIRGALGNHKLNYNFLNIYLAYFYPTFFEIFFTLYNNSMDDV